MPGTVCACSINYIAKLDGISSSVSRNFKALKLIKMAAVYKVFAAILLEPNELQRHPNLQLSVMGSIV
jgi:hypothetical protein